MRRNLIRIFTFLGGIYFFLEFVLPAEFFGIKFDKYNDQISDGFVAVGAMALGLGLINILMVHLSTIAFKRSGFANSIALLFGLMLMLLLSSLDWYQSEKISGDAARFFQLREFSSRISSDYQSDANSSENFFRRNALLRKSVEELIVECEGGYAAAAERAALAPSDNSQRLTLVLERFKKQAAELRAVLARLPQQQALGVSPTVEEHVALGLILSELGGLRRDWLNQVYDISNVKLAYQFIYDGLFVALGSAMFSLLGFYIASAAYRAFRIRSVESALMLGAAILVMLGQIPFGLWISEDLPSWRLWILEVPNSAAFRAIKIGASVAGLVMAFRMWLSIESESFGEGKKR